MAFPSINWIAVVVGAVINMFVGFLWYGPLFGKTWLRWIGKRQEEIESEPSLYLLSAVAALFSSFVLALAVGAFAAGTALGGALVGGLVWLGIGAMGTFVYSLFEGPPLNVWALHASYQLVVFTVLGGMFAVWA